MAARHRSRKRKSFSIPISMGVQTPSTRLSCFLAAAAACMIKEIESVSRRERGDIDKWRGSQLGMIRAGHSLKHPGRGLQPAIGIRAVQRTAENDAIGFASAS